jgi:hypothetical protein
MATRKFHSVPIRNNCAVSPNAQKSLMTLSGALEQDCAATDPENDRGAI